MGSTVFDFVTGDYGAIGAGMNCDVAEIAPVTFWRSARQLPMAGTSSKTPRGSSAPDPMPERVDPSRNARR